MTHYKENSEPDSSIVRSNGWSRRQFLVGATALGAVGLIPVFRITAAVAATQAPPNFPASIALYQQAFQNWSGEIVIEDVWTCVPQTSSEVMTIANWALANGYRIRPRGSRHTWTPLIVPAGSSPANIVLIDTTQHLTSVSIDSSSGYPTIVTAQTGVTMEVLLADLEQAGYGLTATPAPGDVTLGGVLAIDGHGTAIPAQGETPIAGHTYGSVSNLIVSLTAVVWEPSSGQYILRTFARSDSAARALLVHVGRAFITDVTLRVGTNTRLRCQSRVDISAATLFAAPGSSDGSQTFASFVERTGRVETIWFPFTSNPWLKVWTVSPIRPLISREVTTPYNYVFSDTLPKVASKLISEIETGNGAVTPAFAQTQYALVSAGLIGTDTLDIWGWTKNLQLYIRPTTLRVTANGYVVLTNRANIQRVVSEFAAFYQSLLTAYQAQGSYPVNGSMEIRVTGLDTPDDVEVPSASSPLLSALRPRPDHPECNVGVWLDVLTIPGTPQSDQFYRELETWIFSNYSGSYAMVRPEWSKGWAYTNSSAWADPTVLTSTIPNAYRAGQAAGDDWDAGLATLDALDPHRIFTNAFLDTLMP